MRNATKLVTVTTALLCSSMLVMLVGCQGCAGHANTRATTSTKASLQPKLERLATAHPELAGEVQDTIQHWSDENRTEAQTYLAVKPLIAQYQADHPEDDGVGMVMESWQRRLEAFNPGSITPPGSAP